jgi:ribosomal-protein-serine acetyltransferase
MVILFDSENGNYLLWYRNIVASSDLQKVLLFFGKTRTFGCGVGGTKFFFMLQLDIDEEICLEEINHSHAQAIFRIVNKNREYLRKWLTFVDSTCSLEDTLEYINKIKATSHKSTGEEVFAVLFHKRLVGLVGLKKVDWTNRIGEIGYWLDEQYQGNGIMTRSCRKMILHAFEECGFNRLEIKCGVGNLRSIHIPQRLGFSFEGIERDGELVNGSFIDMQVYSMLKKEWKIKDLLKGLYHECSVSNRSFQWNRTGMSTVNGFTQS